MTIAQTGATDALQAPVPDGRVDLWERVRGGIAFAILLAVFITQWAQIHGFRGETDTDEKMRDRVEHDLYYIDNWSLALDLQIMIRTVLSPASYRNAY